MANSTIGSNPAGGGQDALWSPALSAALENFIGISRGTAPVLIQGEEGVGKESLARAVHHASDRADGPFVTVDCRRLGPDDAGGARPAEGRPRRLGEMLEEADGGTAFLREIDALGSDDQQKLSELLSTGSVQSGDDGRSIRVDARIIASTSADLSDAAQSGRFLPALYRSLSIHHVRLPSLREHTHDIIPLARHFLISIMGERDRPVPDLSEATIAVLESYSWPGNLRELREAMHHAGGRVEGDVVEPEHLPSHIGGGGARESADLLTLAELERRHIERVMAATGGDPDRVAEILGIDRRTLQKKLKRYGLS